MGETNESRNHDPQRSVYHQSRDGDGATEARLRISDDCFYATELLSCCFFPSQTVWRELLGVIGVIFKTNKLAGNHKDPHRTHRLIHLFTKPVCSCQQKKCQNWQNTHWICRFVQTANMMNLYISKPAH